MYTFIGRSLALFSALLLMGACAGTGAGVRDDSCFKKTPIPEIARQVIPPAADVPEKFARFSGIWTGGRWSGIICNTLVVFDVRADGSAEILYSYGDNPFGARERYHWSQGMIAGNKIDLSLFPNGRKVEYLIEANGDILEGYSGFAGFISDRVTLRKLK